MTNQLSILQPLGQDGSAVPLPKLSTKAIPPEVLKVLKQSEVKGQSVTLPPGQLPPATYKQVAEALEKMNGRWGKGAFQFAFDPAPLLAQVLEAGYYPKRNPGAYFPTPELVCAQIIECLDLPGPEYWRHSGPPKVLDPSGGQGAFLEAARAALFEAELYAVELDPFNVAELRALGATVIQGDFLDPSVQSQIAELGLFDLMLVNPPFNGLDWADHCLAALSLAKPGGWFGCVYPQSPMLNQGNRAQVQAIRNALAEHLALREELPVSETGFPCDCEFAYLRVNTPSEAQKLRSATSMGYPSFYCEVVALALGCDYEFYRAANKRTALTPAVERLWKTCPQATWMNTPEVLKQVLEIL